MSVFPYNERPLVFLCVRWGRLKNGRSGKTKRQNLTVIDTKPRYAARRWTSMTGATAKLKDTASKASIQPQNLHATHIHTKKQILCFMKDCRFI